MPVLRRYTPAGKAKCATRRLGGQPAGTADGTGDGEGDAAPSRRGWAGRRQDEPPTGKANGGGHRVGALLRPEGVWRPPLGTGTATAASYAPGL